MHSISQGAGRAVVAVHGLGASSFTWNGLLQPLSASYETHMVDLIGFGQSPAAAAFPHTMAAQALELAAWIQAKGLVDPILIGHSMGGGICLRLASMMAAGGAFSVRKMILLAPVTYTPPRPVAGLNIPELRGAAVPRALAPAIGAVLANAILDQAYADRTAITAAQRAGYARGLSTPEQIHAFTHHAQNLDTPTDPAPDYTQIPTETLILWSQRDPFLPFAHGQRLDTELPNSTLRPIANCGHIVHEERPDETLAELLAFLP